MGPAIFTKFSKKCVGSNRLKFGDLGVLLLSFFKACLVLQSLVYNNNLYIILKSERI